MSEKLTTQLFITFREIYTLFDSYFVTEDRKILSKIKNSITELSRIEKNFRKSNNLLEDEFNKSPSLKAELDLIKDSISEAPIYNMKKEELIDDLQAIWNDFIRDSKDFGLSKELQRLDIGLDEKGFKFSRVKQKEIEKKSEKKQKKKVKREELEGIESESDIEGFDDLSEDDQEFYMKMAKNKYPEGSEEYYLALIRFMKSREKSQESDDN